MRNNLKYKYIWVYKSQDGKLPNLQWKNKTKKQFNNTNVLKFKLIIVFIWLFKEINSYNYDFDYYELDNGLKLTILTRKYFYKNILMSLTVNNGNKNDGIYKGASHILEHLIYSSDN